MQRWITPHLVVPVSCLRSIGGGPTQASTTLPPVSYSFDDFLSRLERSPEHQLPPLYTENAPLFEARPDMFIRALGAVSWRRACTLLSAARYRQTLPPDAFRVVLAQMVKHNRSIGGDVPVRSQSPHEHISGIDGCDWRVAFALISDAHARAGADVTGRAVTSALRCCVPHGHWEQAIQLIKHRVKTLYDHERFVAAPAKPGAVRSRRGADDSVAASHHRSLFYISQLPRHSLVEAALACSTEASWACSLQLLDLLATVCPETYLLPVAPGLSQGAAGPNPHSLLPPEPSSGDELSTMPSREDVEAARAVTSHNAELAALVATAHSEEEQISFSKLTPTERMRVRELLCQLCAVCPAEVVDAHPLLRRVLPNILSLGKGFGSDGVEPMHLQVAEEYRVSYLPVSSEMKAQQRWLDLCVRKMSWASALAKLFPNVDGISSDSVTVSQKKGGAKSGSRANIAYTPAIVAALLRKLPLEALREEDEGSSPIEGTPAKIIPWLRQRLPRSVLLHQDVTTALLHRYIEAGNIRAAIALIAPSASVPLGDSSSSGTDPNTSPHSLSLSACPLDTISASTIVLHLWRRGDSRSCIQFLGWCSQTSTRLSSEAVVAAMECVAKESMVRIRHVPGNGGENEEVFEVPPSAVHWKTALSWAVRLPAGTPSQQQLSHLQRRQNAIPQALTNLNNMDTPPLHPRVLSILVFLCAAYGSPHGALRALAYARVHGAEARSASGVDLRHWKALEAVLFCGVYSRPQEAAEIVLNEGQTANGRDQQTEQLAKLVALMFRD